MASLRVPSLRNTVSGAAPYLRTYQRRWAQVHDVRYLATQQSNRVLEKYKEKLDRKAKAYAIPDPSFPELQANTIIIEKDFATSTS
jgi:ATP synthase F1 complex assembly factor 1